MIIAFHIVVYTVLSYIINYLLLKYTQYYQIMADMPDYASEKGFVLGLSPVSLPFVAVVGGFFRGVDLLEKLFEEKSE